MNHFRKLTWKRNWHYLWTKLLILLKKTYMKPNYYKLPIRKYSPVIRCIFFFFTRNIYPFPKMRKYISSLFNSCHSVLTAILFCGLCFGRCTSKIWFQQFDPSHFLCSLGHNKTQDTIPQQLMKLNLPPS